MLILQSCFYDGPSREYGYPAYGYGAPAPVVYGDYDENHAWHERNWWVNSRPARVHEHHPEWLARASMKSTRNTNITNPRSRG